MAILKVLTFIKMSTHTTTKPSHALTSKKKQKELYQALINIPDGKLHFAIIHTKHRKKERKLKLHKRDMNVVDCHGCGLKRCKIIECSKKHNIVNLKRILTLEEENQKEIK